MLQANEEQRKHIEKMLGEDSDLMYALDDGIKVDSYISYDEMAAIVDYLRTSNKKGDVQEFVEKVYKMYPSKCPMRETSLGKCSKDKERIAKLLKKYTMEEIEAVVKYEIEEKYGKHYMANLSTFLNNFPDPQIILGENKTNEMQKSEELVINGQKYK